MLEPIESTHRINPSKCQGAHPLAGLSVASGTNAAYYAIINICQAGATENTASIWRTVLTAGDNFVSSKNLYGGTYTQFDNILPAFGITCRFVDINNPEEIAAAIDEKTRCVYTETVANPRLQVTDMDAVVATAHAAGLPVVVDDTFTTPWMMKPFDYGADVICHSLTKWTGGHGTGIGGIVVDSGRFNWKAGKHPLYDDPDMSYGGLRWGHDLPEALAPLAYILRMRTVPLRNLGGCLSPDNAWMFLQGIETLSMRMERHCTNALAVARHLKAHPGTAWVRYPGLEDNEEYGRNKKYLGGRGGAMVVFGIKGGVEGGKKLINAFKLFSHVANVGDAKSLAIHPATTTHSQLNEEQQLAAGVPPELVRLSIGIEDITDILSDLDQAIAVSQTSKAKL
jgi:O-acetylhomoserine (thiol)-lyase